MNDYELGRIGQQRVAQLAEYLVEVQHSGHHPMVQVEMVGIRAWAQVKGTYAQGPLLGDSEILRAGILVSQFGIATGPTGTRGGIVCAGDGEGGHIGPVRQACHPILTVSLQAQQTEAHDCPTSLYHSHIKLRYYRFISFADIVPSQPKRSCQRRNVSTLSSPNLARLRRTCSGVFS